MRLNDLIKIKTILSWCRSKLVTKSS